jgi:hypothetical protein
VRARSRAQPANDPSVFPKERLLTVSNDHACGGLDLDVLVH